MIVEPFTEHTGRLLPLRASDVDTDQIIPARWLKRISRDGFGDGLFESWRAAPDFVLNRPERQGATVLVAGPDFGTGSSREHAVWALQDHGFRVVISSRFADIFRGNSLKNGLLTVVLPQPDVESLWELTERDPTVRVTVDLRTCEIRADGTVIAFEFDPDARRRLLEGLDDITMTLHHDTEITAFEARRPTFAPTTRTATRRISLAVVPGDGIGPEVVAQGLKVLNAVLPERVKLETQEFDFGARRYHRSGELLTDADLTALRAHDAILLGAIGDPSVPSGVLERGFLLRLRFAFDHYVNLRPGRLLPGVTGPLRTGEIDFVVVREGTEGPYTGNGGVVRPGGPHTIATEVSINTALGVDRVVRDAFTRAAARPRRTLTLVHKDNVLVHAGGLWREVFHRVAPGFPTVRTEYLHVDAAAMKMVTDPGWFDVIVTDNLFGDILTDLAAAVCGGIGLAASGNINPSGEFPSMFEPVHGSAPDIAGSGTADPTAAVSSVAMLLRHLGHTAEADRVDAAVAADLATRGGTRRSTDEIGDALATRVAR